MTLNVLNFDGNFDGSKTCDKHGMTSLNLAAPRGRLDLVKHLKHLVEQDVNLRITDKYGRTTSSLGCPKKQIGCSEI